MEERGSIQSQEFREMLLKLGVWHETRVCSEIKKKKKEKTSPVNQQKKAQALMLRTQVN